jgi:hypothetical protein
MASDLSLVPEEIRDWLLRHQSELVQNGMLQYRQDNDRHPSWRIRVWITDETTGLARRRSLALGNDEEVVQALSCWLRSLKAARFAEMEAEKFDRDRQKETARRERAEFLEQARMVGQIVGGGRDRQSRARAEYRRLTDPQDRLFFLQRLQQCPLPRKKGRPRKYSRGWRGDPDRQFWKRPADTEARREAGEGGGSGGLPSS